MEDRAFTIDGNEVKSMRTVTQTELEQMIAAGQIFCQWFAACPRAATHLEPHPILHLVPTCDHCHTG